MISCFPLFGSQFLLDELSYCIFHTQCLCSALRAVHSYGHLTLTLVLCAACGVMWPSLPDAVYLLTFFGGTLWIALGRSLTGSRVYRLGRLALVTLAALQLLALYLYQLQSSQSWIDPANTLPVLIGLVAFVRFDCTEPWVLHLYPLEKPADWARLAYPLLVGALYALLIPQLRKEEFLREQVSHQ